jgi:hypothetical protein
LLLPNDVELAFTVPPADILKSRYARNARIAANDMMITPATAR